MSVGLTARNNGISTERTVAAPEEGLRLNLEAEPVAVPGECEGLKVVIHTKVQGVNVESRVLKSTVEIDIHNGKTLSQELQRIHFTHSVSGGLFLPRGVIKAVGCMKSGVENRT